MTDWTDGVPRLVVFHCGRCGHQWYLPREHCPVCGGADVGGTDAVGTGLCVAVTRVHVTLDPGEPVGLVLVELDEGPLVMGRSHDQSLEPGDRARVAFRIVPDPSTGSGLVPSFAREGTE